MSNKLSDSENRTETNKYEEEKINISDDQITTLLDQSGVIVENTNILTNNVKEVKSNNRDAQRDGNKEHALFGFFGGGPNQKNPPTVWVQFFGAAGAQNVPTGGTPLNYDPSRNYFVKIVFCIVLIMLALTATFNVFVYTMPGLKDIFQQSGLMLLLPAVILMFIMSYAMTCSACSRVMPCNIICLLLVVCAMSVITAYFTVRYDTRIIFYAVAATCAVVFVCILLACSNFDFTKFMLYIIVVAVAFAAIATIISLTWLITGEYSKPIHIVILIVGTLINVVVLVMELQMVLGGKTVELSEDDYALAAYLLYSSIIDIFIKLLQLFGILDDS